jgi:NAD-dependent SIR2 family protein deacetylase
MKPAGIERDREIAEIRGDDWLLECLIGCENVFQMSKQKAEEQATCPACGEEVRAYPKPYSTDIATAFELAEDMRTATDADGFDILYEAVKEWLEIGKPFADAISGAWLEWRDNER